MRAVVAIGAAALLLVGCGHLPGHRAVPRGGETITYHAVPVGLCPYCARFAVTLGPDGQGIFTGERNTSVIGDRRFRATPEQTAAFARRLHDYRPNGEVLMTGSPFCKSLATDQDHIDVRWQSADGTSPHLLFYAGCDMDKNRKMADALASAPSLLPIADLIGAH